ncbi:PCYCGC motif-containing (lipo)protein [Bacillus sp. DNRA2]|uniref:PCYCGC motif-containing (lipo)protein n=1 Tax=Bacillus sp. DNRA2 TaxID=2723053 RepID=UPI0032B747CE
MESLKLLGMISILFVLILVGCGKKEDLVLDSKHIELPDYVLNTSEKIQNTYIMAATYPEALSAAPCYCGCNGSDGHESVLDCFVDSFGKDKNVTGWDQMGIACDICVVIANEATEMHLDGKDRKEIYNYITKKYDDYGEPTPTPVPK